MTNEIRFYFSSYLLTKFEKWRGFDCFFIFVTRNFFQSMTILMILFVFEKITLGTA